MRKPRRDPIDKMIERDGGSIRRRGFLLVDKPAPIFGTRQKNRQPKSRRASRESYFCRKFDESMESVLRTALRKLPHLRAYELKNRTARRKLIKKIRKRSMKDRRLLRRVTIKYLCKLAKTPPYTALN